MKSATSMVAIVALWSGWPNTACMCANGGMKVFCDAHRFDGKSVQSSQVQIEQRNCCHHHAPIQKHDQSEQQIKAKGCTPLAGTPVIAPTSVSKNFDSHQTAIAFLTLPVATIGIPSLHPAILPSARYTGPPVDIVTELHRFLI
jgi:hypothetical protein